MAGPMDLGGFMGFMKATVTRWRWPAMTWVNSNGDEVVMGALKTLAWDGTPLDAGDSAEVQLDIINLSGGDTIVVKGSVSGDAPVTLTGANLNTNATLTSITADGVYSFPACGKIQYAKTGTASTPTINLLRK